MMYNERTHTLITVDPLLCSDISRAVLIGMSWQKHAATFRGQRNFEVWRNFKEIQYLCSTTHCVRH